MIRRIAVVATVGLLLSSPAMAAETARLGAVSGSVMVNQNGRFAPAARGTVLQTGDRVMATNGSASLVYSDGCNVSIAAKSMATVAAVSPCAGGSSNVVKVSTATRADDDDRGAYGYGDDYDFWLWLTYGVVTAAVVGAAVSDDETPNSP